VAEAYAEGAGNQRVASALGVSRRTIARYVAKLEKAAWMSEAKSWEALMQEAERLVDHPSTPKDPEKRALILRALRDEPRCAYPPLSPA
jgi:AcrR family transcriptional regulator